MSVAVSLRRASARWLLGLALASCTRSGAEAGGGSASGVNDTAGNGAAGGAASSGAAGAAAHLTSPLTLASETAFDLTVSERGALLAWAAARAPGTLHVRRFDARGEPLAPPPGAAPQRLGALERALPPASGAMDLALVEAQGGVSVVWREPGDPGAARGLWLDPGGAAQPLELGVVWGAAQAGRGNVALAARGEGALALVRGPRERCLDAPAPGAAGAGAVGGAESAAAEPCFGFRFYRLSARGAEAVGFGLHVPVPCDARAALLLAPPGSAEQRYHYAVCTRAEGETVLTAFSIEPARSYAAAQRVLPGCQPLGAALFAGHPTFVAECRGSRRIARFVDADSPFAVQRADVRGLVCRSANAGGPRVRLGDGWLALAGPQAGLELLLDTELSPPGSRAVWTGGALLVARASGGRLALDRYACFGTELQQQPVALE